jgi:hypothetical protein
VGVYDFHGPDDPLLSVRHQVLIFSKDGEKLVHLPDATLTVERVEETETERVYTIKIVDNH